MALGTLESGGNIEASCGTSYGDLLDADSVGVSASEVQARVAASEEVDEEEFPEGRLIYRLHRASERSRVLVERKKASVLKANGRLACEACAFDFAAVYGPWGWLHRVPLRRGALSTLSTTQKTKLEDLVFVCSHCHRMIHRKRPWLTAVQEHRVARRAHMIRSCLSTQVDHFPLIGMPLYGI